MTGQPDVIDRPAAVRPGEELDAERLAAFLREQVPGADGPVEIQQFPSGYSNLTYRVRCGDADLVLRRPPAGNHVKSAHDMGREYRVLSALHPVYPAAPEPLAYCEDEAILGAPFYVMRRVEGIVLRSRPPAGLDLDEKTMRRLCENFVDNLADLHAIDVEAAGLGDLGRPVGYTARQVKGWTSRYEKAATDDLPDMFAIAAYLADHLPPEQPGTLIHNDYKFDNVILDAADPTKILAVLDWEMCTLGDPLTDLGTALSYWVEPGDTGPRRAFVPGPTDLPGAMTRRQFAERYAERTGRSLDHLLFYYLYGVFKLAVIIQQIYRRYVEGHSRDERFAQLGEVVKGLARTGVISMEEAG